MTATKKHKRFSVSLLCFLCFFVAGFCYAQSPTVTKVDPPSWWARHSINPVRLLVRGTNLRSARVTSTNPELRVSDVSANERGTYLFVNVEIGSSLRPGTYSLLVQNATGSTRI